MTEVHLLYRKLADAALLKIKKLSKQIRLLSLARLITFLGIVVSPFLFIPHNLPVGINISFASLLLFLLFVKWHLKLQRDKQFQQCLLKINEQELKALNHNFTEFDPGKEFVNPGHRNSYDLDLFGDGSVFQFLNRTVTAGGKKVLASFFQNPLQSKNDIENRQAFVKELVDDYKWRQQYMVHGMMYEESATESDIFQKWAGESFNLRVIRFFIPLKYFLYAFSLFSVVFWIVYGNSAFFMLSVVLQLSLWLYNKTGIQKAYAEFGKRASILGKYGMLLAEIEKAGWKSSEGADMVEVLKKDGSPSEEIARLRKIVSAFDNRNNFLMGVILNVLFLWDINCTYRLIQWHSKNSGKYEQWGRAIAYTDAVVSLANLGFNHPEYVFPEIIDSNFIIEAKGVGHPLIIPEKRVDNDFTFDGNTGVMIITGANMAGKSTFLRTLGVNMVMGALGAPVCASLFRFKPVEVYTNMRTTDSLVNDESYFFAELKRIKEILDEIEKGKELFIILDEILKGTNSVDKLSGSQQLIRRLMAEKAKVVIATHDLKLTEMESEYPDKLRNKCFEIEIINNEMKFDYLLRDGVTSVMNATFLMKKMGIIKSL
jgi:ABC-type multidrug transport system fused ATPase/permease subunit